MSKAPFCKDSYIGAPVRAYVHACEYCGKTGGCSCGAGSSCGGQSGICQAVVDDANGRVYLYGNISHENYHVPGGDCIAYAAVASAGFEEFKNAKDEFFEGQQDGNNIRLAETPIKDNTFMVFLNGVKQREGAENDYVVNNNIVHFNFRNLLPKDLVEVMYTYSGRN